ncbi:TetR/AcrR family transcriptional regulator [Agromyces sp. NPDC055520]
MSSAPRIRAARKTPASRKTPAERRVEIAAAARGVALGDGLSAVTLRAVASRASVTPALVAHYQPSMEALIAETFDAIVGAEIEEIGALLAERRSPHQRLATLIDTMLDGSREDVTVVWVEAWALGRRNEPLAASVRRQMDAWQSVIVHVIDDGVESGDFGRTGPVDVAAAAWQLLGMIDGLNAQALVRWDGAGERGALTTRSVEGLLGLQPGALAAASAG